MRTTRGPRRCSASNGPRLLMQTLALAGAMAGLSGMLIVAQYGGLGFAGGFQYGLKALIAAIIGGIGSVPGALLGGFAVGLFETLWSAYLPIEARDMALYAALVVFLIFRPGGLLGIQGSDTTTRLRAYNEKSGGQRGRLRHHHRGREARGRRRSEGRCCARRSCPRPACRSSPARRSA